jgi:hypothetical protein
MQACSISGITDALIGRHSEDAFCCWMLDVQVAGAAEELKV